MPATKTKQQTNEQAPHKPLQARSLATMNRILDETEKLMVHASFENISISTILKRAAVQPGSFYARFPDKISLLAALYERYATDIEAILNRQLPALEKLNGEQQIISVIGLIRKIYCTRRGVARSAVLHYWNCSIESPLLENLSRRHAQLIKRISGLFLNAAGKLGGRQSKQRSAFALKMVLVSCREHFLFAHQSKTLRFSNQEFESELAEMVIGHLKVSGKRK
jgi:AcrR family transcriptional regulator